MNNRLLEELLLFIFICILALPFEFSSKLKRNKKAKLFFMCMVFSMVGIYATFTSIKDNPKVEASLHSNYIELKKGEKIDFDEIENVKYYGNVIIKINPNGYRWGNDNYYSGDANVNIMAKNGNELEDIYKAKVYINTGVDAYIVMDVPKINKKFVFNLNDKQKTKKMYQCLIQNSFAGDY